MVDNSIDQQEESLFREPSDQQQNPQEIARKLWNIWDHDDAVCPAIPANLVRSAARALDELIVDRAKQEIAIAKLNEELAQRIALDSDHRQGLSVDDLIASLQTLEFRYNPGSEPQRRALRIAQESLREYQQAQNS